MPMVPDTDVGAERTPACQPGQTPGRTLSSDGFCLDWLRPSLLSGSGWMAGQMALKVPPEEDNRPHCLRVRGHRSWPPALIQQSKGAPDDDKPHS